MARIGRRKFFAASAAALGAGLAYGPRRGSASLAAAAAWREQREAYPQGVASADPMPDSVILWTRRPPIPDTRNGSVAGLDAESRARELSVEVATDPQFTHVVARGTTEVNAGTDWTCRFLAAGLEPSSEYWY